MGWSWSGKAAQDHAIKLTHQAAKEGQG